MKHVESDPSGRYIRYDQLLGRGSFKAVYKAFDTHEAVEVAWNKLQIDRIPKTHLQKVQFEVDLLKRVGHKNIINLFAAWRCNSKEGNSTIDFVTELMTSGTLKEYLSRSRVMKLKVIRRWCHNLLDAIAYLHEQNPPVMHRDLKCDNIFINGNVGEVKIGDLGLSCVKKDTVAQSVIGTPEFMAPELYEEAYTEKVDIYAFGMCMLEMLTMEYPYAECENPAQIFRKVFAGERPLSFQRLPQSEIKQVIAACLEHENCRPSARDLLMHPFFSEWASDDGMATNLTLVGHNPNWRGMSVAASAMKGFKETLVAKGRFSDLRMGQSMVFNAQNIQKEVLIAREKTDVPMHRPKVYVTPANDVRDFRVSLTIAEGREARRVEFFYDPEMDNIELVTGELADELCLAPSVVEKIVEDIQMQVSEELSILEDERLYSRKLRERDAIAEHFREHAGIEAQHILPMEHSGAKGQSSLHRPVRAPNSITEHPRRELPSSGSRNLPGSRNPISRESSADHVPSISSDSNSSPTIAAHTRIYQDGDSNPSVTCTKDSSHSFDLNKFRANMALMDHCANGKLDTVRQKLELGSQADFADYDRRTPLHLAATEGYHEVVALLIKYGADIDAEDRWGSKPIHEAKRNNHENVVEILVNAGARVETRSISPNEINSMELLQYSANGFYDMVKEKLMAGAAADFADYDKRTPLHLACAEDHPDVVELLLMNGADPMFEDRFGSSAMDEAVKNGNMSLLPILKRYGGTLPAHLLTREDAEYEYGMALVNHASRGRVKMVKYLLQRGANVRYADYDKRTALHLACVEGHAEVVKVLLEAGGDPGFHDRWSMTPRDEAMKNNHTNVTDVIEEATGESADEIVVCSKNGESSINKFDSSDTAETSG